MSEITVVALISFIGTILGSVIGVLTANKLVNHRIEQLEKAIDKMTATVERIAIIERDLQTAFARIDDKRDRLNKHDIVIQEIRDKLFIIVTKLEKEE